MSTKFQIKRSSVSGKTPNTTNISPGELAINLTDQKLYSSNGTAIFEIGAATNTSQYLEVANAAFVVGNNTTQYLEVANAVGLIQENTNQFLAVANATVYLEVANVSQYIPANTSISTVAYESTNTTLTVTTEDGRNLDADLSGLVDEVRANTSISNVAFTSANNNLKIQTEHGTVFSVDLSPLVVSTTEYLEVANAAPLIANQTTQFLEVANAEPLIANLTTKYLEVANTVYNYKTTFNYTATAGQKEFTGTDLNGQVLDYYGNTAEVFLNGIKQIKGTDWYANTDSIVTLSVGAGVNDTVEIVSVNAITEFVSAPDLTAYLVQSDLNPYLEVANLASQTEQYMQVANLAQVATTGNYSHLTGTPSLATVATTGSYNDLSGTPTIPSTDPFLQVANAVPLIQENTSKYLEVANVVATDTSAYLEKANASIYLEVANLAAETSKYLEKANASIYLEVANVAANTSTSSAAISGNTATFTRADGSTFTLDVSTLYDRYVTASATSGNNLTITLNDGSTVTVDLGPLVAGAANNLYVQAGAVSGNTLTLTLNDASTVDIDVSSLSDPTTQYLEVANLAPATSKYLEKANASIYLEVANVVLTNTDPYLEVANLAPATSKYLEKANASIYLEVANVAANTSTSTAAISGNTATFTRADGSTYDLDLSSLSDPTTQYLEVANASVYAEMANVVPKTGGEFTGGVNIRGQVIVGYPNTAPSVITYGNMYAGRYFENGARLSTNNYVQRYLEVANVVTTNTDPYLEVANASVYLEKANASIYLEVANVAANTSTASAAISGNTATFTRADGSTFDLDVSTLYDRYVVSSNTSGNNLTITLNDGSDVTVDLGPLVAGAANNLYVQSGAVSGNTLTLTLNDASTVDIDVASINDTTNYLEVANAAPLIANQTTQFLTVANAAPLIANLTTKYMEVANIEYNYKSSFHFNANAGQTEFTGTDQNGQTLDYYGNTAEVYLNGIKLIRGSDWYANTDSIVTISEPAGTGDVLEIVSINTITQFISAPDLTAYLVQSDLNPYLEVANLTSQTTKYMEVANLAQVATTGNYSHLTGTPSLATVATTGSYNDLSGTPTIPTTTEYLQVANAVALIANNTTKYLEVANAGGSTSQYLEVANVNQYLTPYLEVANVSQYIPANTSTASAAISGNTATFTRDDGSTFTLDVSTLYDRYITGSSTSGNNLTMTLNDGSTVTVDLGPLVAGAANNLYVQSGAVSGNTLTLTLNDASTVAIDVASLNDMTNYLEVANAAALIANNTTKYIEVANAVVSVDTTLTGNTSIQRLDIANAVGTQINSTGLTNGVYFGNNYFISSYDFETNTTSTSKTTIAQSRGDEVAIEFLVLVTDTTSSPKNRQFSKILVVHDDFDVFISEYGQMYTGSGPLASFSAHITWADDIVYLEANPTTSNRLKYKVVRMGMRD